MFCPSGIEEEFSIAIRCQAKEIVMFLLAVQVSYLEVARGDIIDRRREDGMYVALAPKWPLSPPLPGIELLKGLISALFPCRAGAIEQGSEQS
jgi:hypothetical protein